MTVIDNRGGTVRGTLRWITEVEGTLKMTLRGLRGSLIGWRSRALLGLVGLVVGGGLRIDTDRLIKLQWDKVQNNSPSLSG